MPRKKKRSSRILPRNMLRLSEGTLKALEDRGMSPRWVAKDEIFRRQDQGFHFASDVMGLNAEAEHRDQTLGGVPERHDCVLMCIEQEARDEYFEEVSDAAEHMESGVLRTARETMNQSVVDGKMEINNGTKVIT